MVFGGVAARAAAAQRGHALDRRSLFPGQPGGQAASRRGAAADLRRALRRGRGARRPVPDGPPAQADVLPARGRSLARTRCPRRASRRTAASSTSRRRSPRPPSLPARRRTCARHLASRRRRGDRRPPYAPIGQAAFPSRSRSTSEQPGAADRAGRRSARLARDEPRRGGHPGAADLCDAGRGQRRWRARSAPRARRCGSRAPTRRSSSSTRPRASARFDDVGGDPDAALARPRRQRSPASPGRSCRTRMSPSTSACSAGSAIDLGRTATPTCRPTGASPPTRRRPIRRWPRSTFNTAAT